MRFFREKKLIIPTLMSLIVIILLAALGTWQIERLKWKKDLLEKIEAGTEKNPVPVDSSTSQPFSSVSVNGKILKDKSLFLTPRMNAGERGAHLIVPVQQNNGTTYLVDMGWVPDNFDSTTLPNSIDNLTGILRMPAEKGMMQPDNDLGNHIVFWYDMPEIQKELDLKNLQPLIIERDKRDMALPHIKQMPIAQESFKNIPNHHLQYALTWYSLAIVLIIIYILYLRRHFLLKPLDSEVEQKLKDQLNLHMGRGHNDDTTNNT